MIKKPKILVVGSMVMDLIVSTETFPISGQTVLGKAFRTAPGGKGLNQAVQAARLGASVTMVGKTGQDMFGTELQNAARAAGVNTEHIGTEAGVASAIGNVLLEVAEGQSSKNRIIVVPGANMCITPADIAFLERDIVNYDLVILQLEIPMQINELVAELAHRNNIPVMLNPAPSTPLSDKLISNLTYISPNEHEAADLTGVKIRLSEDGSANKEDVRKAAGVLLDKGCKNVIITLGRNGAVMANRDSYIEKPCVDIVKAIDPTAAGDSFVASFCTGFCAGLNTDAALDLASYAAALTVSRMGAIPSLPTNEEVCVLMRSNQFSNFDVELLKPLL